MTDDRTYPPLEADERATLTAFLDYQRATLALKCDGLPDDQLRQRAVPPSSLSLLGLFRHMAEVERNWFRLVLGGEEMAGIFSPDMDWEVAFRDAATADVTEAFRPWRAGVGELPPAEDGGLPPLPASYRDVPWPQWQRTTCPLPSQRSARAVGGNEDKGLRLGCLT